LVEVGLVFSILNIGKNRGEWFNEYLLFIWIKRCSL